MAFIPPHFLNTVVALGLPSQDGKIQYTATGFLYGSPTGATDESGNMRYHIFLVTNRHVFKDIFKNSDTLCARFNKPMNTGAHVYSIQKEESSLAVHSDVDVAVLGIDHNVLDSSGIEYSCFAGDTQAFRLEQALTKEISEGDGVFVLGFPLGQAGDERNYVIVRHGIIARIQDCLKGDARTFLIDSSIFPGNSGGPILLKPEISSIRGTKPNSQCVLIGMISSYLPYQEVAVSEQTGRRRMVFEENSGLGVVVPIDLIQETVDILVRKLELGESADSDTQGAD
ncbi:MAG: Serine protease SplC [Verrucomicrobia subdivision 3 bacterium]|nr:Serine protease SplC [Limisphaerales bacterium]MCS1412982.1 Serine protease SplC [Limisphaerales bacterium]